MMDLLEQEIHGKHKNDAPFFFLNEQRPTCVFLLIYQQKKTMALIETAYLRIDYFNLVMVF